MNEKNWKKEGERGKKEKKKEKKTNKMKLYFLVLKLKELVYSNKTANKMKIFEVKRMKKNGKLS